MADEPLIPVDPGNPAALDAAPDMLPDAVPSAIINSMMATLVVNPHDALNDTSHVPIAKLPEVIKVVRVFAVSAT
jgi:hypothetical protein